MAKRNKKRQVITVRGPHRIMLGLPPQLANLTRAIEEGKVRVKSVTLELGKPG